MTRLIMLFAGAICLLSTAARSAETLHVAHSFAEPPFETDRRTCPSVDGDGLVGYVGERRVCADVLAGDLRSRADLLDGTVDEIVLLTSRPSGRTLYRVPPDRGAILPLANLVRRTGHALVIRGQRDAGGDHLVWFKGLDLIDTVCDPERVLDAAACRDGRPSAATGSTESDIDERYEMTSVAAVESARIGRVLGHLPTGLAAVTAKHDRSYCVSLSQVRGLILDDLAFEDCWLTAVKAVNTSDVTLRRALIHGSTFGMLAIATEGMEPASHTFQVLDSRWIQSPGAYRPEGGRPCTNPHLDLACALDVWDDIPWGVTHHHIWRPLNGGLFGAYNIAGNVLVAGNTIERAYNGIRMISELPGTGRNVEVRDNTFLFVRDNAVEPEGRADGWVVRHNTFRNVHGWISTDGVQGSGMYVYGNLGWYDPDRMPASGCSDSTPWADSPRFLGLAGDAGRYGLIDVSYDPTSVACRGHYRGVIIKTGDKRNSGFPYLDTIAVFHNSWRTRSPLFSSKHASPLSHFNNAIAFTGCGLDGPWDCRQIPAPPEYCAAGNKRTRGLVGMSQFWTDDGGALIADCFSFTPGPAEPDARAAALRDVSHEFCHDAFNRTFGGVPYGAGSCAPIFRTGLFADADGAPGALAPPIAGCAVVLSDSGVHPDCSRQGAPVGAVMPDGALYDVTIPGTGFLGADFRP